MATESAPQGNVAERHVAPDAAVGASVEAVPAARDTALDFSPEKKSATWSDVANQCNLSSFEGLRTCASAVGDKFGQTFRNMFGGSDTQPAGKALEEKGILPATRIEGTGAEIVRASSDALPAALRGENKHRTETVLNAKAEPQDRLKAANELIKAGITSFTVQQPDGTTNRVRLEKEPAGKNNLLAVFVGNKDGAELNALRAVQRPDGTLVQQKSAGKPVDFKNRGAALLDRISESGTVVTDGSGAAERRREPRERPAPSPGPESTREPRERPDPTRVERAGEWKSPFQRRYEEGDKFKGVTSVYWQDSTTASGIRFRKDEHTAASREFPFGTVLNVRNPKTGLETRVVVTDHGPFAGDKKPRPDGSGSVHERVVDLADGAAKAIGMGRTVKELEISVVSIPEGGAWGGERRNLRKDGKEALIAQVRQVTEEEKGKRAAIQIADKPRGVVAASEVERPRLEIARVEGQTVARSGRMPLEPVTDPAILNDVGKRRDGTKIEPTYIGVDNAASYRGDDGKKHIAAGVPAWLDKPVAQAFVMMNEKLAEKGKRVILASEGDSKDGAINSAGRSHTQQKIATGIRARPGFSEHERGAAIDVRNHDDPDVKAALKEFGFVQGNLSRPGFAIPNDAWHYSFNPKSMPDIQRRFNERQTRLGLPQDETPRQEALPREQRKRR